MNQEYFKDKIWNEVQMAIQDMAKEDRKKINLEGMFIIVNWLDIEHWPTSICGWPVLGGTVPTSFTYYAAFRECGNTEKRFLKSLDNIINEDLYEHGVRA